MVDVVVRTTIDDMDIPAHLRIYLITDPATLSWELLHDGIGGTQIQLELGYQYYFYAYLIDDLGYLWSCGDQYVINVEWIPTEGIRLGIPVDNVGPEHQHHFPFPPKVVDDSIPKMPPDCFIVVHAYDAYGNEVVAHVVLVDNHNMTTDEYDTPLNVNRKFDYGYYGIIVSYQGKEKQAGFNLAPGETVTQNVEFDGSPPDGNQPSFLPALIVGAVIIGMGSLIWMGKEKK